MVNINQQLKKGLFWTAIERYSGQVFGMLISMVLARLITPSDFGVVATATVLLCFLSMFTSIGIAPAIIQRKDLSQEDIDQIFTFTIYMGAFIGLISFASSWFIADYYGNPLLKPVIQILSADAFFASLTIVPGALMSKHLRFKEKATRTLIFQVVFGIMGIVAAFLGGGVYALIGPIIISTICTFFYYYHFYPTHFKIRFSLEPIKKIFSYSVYVFLAEFFGYFSGNLDKLIIGKSISPAALGYYEKSYRMMLMPIDNITSVLNPVIHPVFSNLQDDMQEMAAKYNRIVSVIATFGFPMAVILFFSAHEIIYVLFGDQWEAAVPAFKILSLSIPFILLCKPHGPVCLAANASKRMFYVGIENSLLIIAGITIGAFCFGTIEAIAWGRATVSILVMLNCYHNLYVKIMKVPCFTFVKEILRPVLTALILLFVYLIYTSLFVTTQWEIVNLLIKVSLGGLTFIACFFAFGDKSIISLFKR